jgi:ribonuclease BN (tRNA processing enzyme)
MKLRVLGCDGGRGINYYATGLLFNDTVLIDAGTILSALTVEEALQITDIFLTHGHLDHLCELPFLLDATFERRREPLRVHGTKSTLNTMMTHIFNNQLWPDFSKLPTPSKGQFTTHVIEPGHTYKAGGLGFTPVPVNHTVPTVGYKVADTHGVLMFSGDTGPMTEFWQVANDTPALKALILDLSFPVNEQRIANLSKHMTATDVEAELKKLSRPCDVYTFHYKVGQATTLGAQAQRIMHFGKAVKVLRENDIVMI